MKRNFLISILAIVLVCPILEASEKDSLSFQTQLSLFSSFNPTNSVNVQAGVRVIPQIDYLRDFTQDRRISAEVSANFNLNSELYPFNDFQDMHATASARLYRAWVRFSTQRNEIRAGLQQLNFGSASLLRPLQWFDGMNPTDPLRLTYGVWGILDRLYFENNSTLWLWGLYGNTEQRIWDPFKNRTDFPEIGFRYQHPLGNGELALSVNHRMVDAEVLASPLHYQETKIGLDGKWDVGPGIWFENSFTATSTASPLKKGSNMLTVGADLTPEGLDGLSFTIEHLLNTTYSVDDHSSTSMNLTALSATWPINVFSRLSGIVLYSWEADYWFRYLTYSADFDRSSFYLIGFWNPNLSSSLLSLGSGAFSNYGFQLMYVLNL